MKIYSSKLDLIAPRVYPLQRILARYSQGRQRIKALNLLVDLNLRRSSFPPIDIFETEEGLVLLADLPGVTAETLELQVQDNRLTLFGRVQHPEPEDARLIHQEYRVGPFFAIIYSQR
ncbi:MAG: hypothetical protein KatS3mg113_0911 [Planctomycetaceae bacterium]|nr:MAG: hypothetical protein KatS3mg113_0911 [Planctomycetaceae bacterium]